MKRAEQQQREQAQQEAKARRELSAPKVWGNTRMTHEQLVEQLRLSRLVHTPTRAELESENYKRQSALMGEDALKAFAEGNDEKGRYFAGQSFNLALHALGRLPEYYPWLLLKYAKVHKFKTQYEG